MEIGSIFEINPDDIFLSQEKKFPSLPVQQRLMLLPYYFNTGRAAIEALLKKLLERGYTKVYLPSFLCDSVRDAVLRVGIQLEYYRVNRDFSVNPDEICIDEHNILFVVQYFGQRINKEFLDFVKLVKQKNVIIIEDISLSLLSDDEGYVGFGNYLIGSLRKWFPIIDGGILLSRIDEEFQLADASFDYTLYYFMAQILKSSYLKSSDRNPNNKQVFLSYNNDGMKSLFSDYTIRKMSRISADLLKGLDYQDIRNKRIKNYDLLRTLIEPITQVKVLVDRRGTMTPLAMVILSEERDELLRYLISHDIYCNVHWKSNECTVQFPESEYLAARCITIPCDHRYGKEEMHYIARAIEAFYEDVDNV